MELARPGAPDRPPTWGSNQSREAIHQIIPISPLHMPLSRRSSRIITPRFIDQRSIERELAREGDEGGARQAGRQREALVGGCPEAGRHRARGHPCRPAGGGLCVCGPGVRRQLVDRRPICMRAPWPPDACIHRWSMGRSCVHACPTGAAAFCANAGRPVPCMEAKLALPA